VSLFAPGRTEVLRKRQMDLQATLNAFPEAVALWPRLQIAGMKTVLLTSGAGLCAPQPTAHGPPSAVRRLARPM
jgi:hypothetical protein